MHISRFWMFGLANSVMALGAVVNAYVKKRQFYPACMYLAQSDASYMILLSFSIYCALLLGTLLQTVFLGPLRLIEAEHLYENSWYSISEIFLAMTIFREEFDTRFAFFFCLLLAVKMFHWLVKDRLDYMEQTPILTRLFHARMISLLTFLTAVDICFANYSVNHVLSKGPSMMIMFAFENGILLVQMMSLIIKYILNVIDLQNEEPWEGKSIYLFYMELVSDFFKLCLYTGFFIMIVHYYGIPLHIIRDLYMTFRSFVLRIRDLIQYRRATTNMDQRYPNATPVELAATDRVCIICREEMELAKKLPCGHLFHFQCLRSWLERQQTCPICRRSVLEEDRPVPTTPDARPPPGAAPAQGQGIPHQVYPGNFQAGTAGAPANIPIVIIPPGFNPILANAPILNSSSPILLSRFGAEEEREENVEDLGLELMSDEQLHELEGELHEDAVRRVKYLRQLSAQLNRLNHHMEQLSRVLKRKRRASAHSTS